MLYTMAANLNTVTRSFEDRFACKIEFERTIILDSIYFRETLFGNTWEQNSDRKKELFKFFGGSRTFRNTKKIIQLS